MTEFEKDGVRIGLLAAEEPPPIRTGNRQRRDAIDALLPLLREQRGTWFRIGEFAVKSAAGSTATRLRKAEPAYEWKARANGRGSVLWGRYVEKTKR